MSNRVVVLFALLSFVVDGPSWAGDWPGWRGPRLDGHSAETNVPVKWSGAENVAWTAPIPGVGHSSPIVSNGRVFVTSCIPKEESRWLICLDRVHGKELWRKEVFQAPLEPKHGLNSYASATPASDGKHVWVAFQRLRTRTPSDDMPRKPREAPTLKKADLVSEMFVACYDFEGNLVWSRTPGQFYSPHGFCTSPILYKDTIILNGDQDAEAYLVALDKATGAERWRTERPNRYRSYCAPLIIQAAGRNQLVLSGAKTVASYDPDTGKPHWSIDGPAEQFVASPVFNGELVFVTAGFPTFHNIAIRPDGQGNVSKTHVEWHEKATNRKAAYVPSPIAVGDHFYVISDTGFLSCFEAKSGKRCYMEQLDAHHSGSPVHANGLIYIVSDEGVTYVVKAGPTFEVVSRNLLGDRCYSSPAISDGQIFLRGSRGVTCIGTK